MTRLILALTLSLGSLAGSNAIADGLNPRKELEITNICKNVRAQELAVSYRFGDGPISGDLSKYLKVQPKISNVVLASFELHLEYKRPLDPGSMDTFSYGTINIPSAHLPLRLADLNEVSIESWTGLENIPVNDCP